MTSTYTVIPYEPGAWPESLRRTARPEVLERWAVVGRRGLPPVAVVAGGGCCSIRTGPFCSTTSPGTSGSGGPCCTGRHGRRPDDSA